MSWAREFREFAIKGNVVDLAVGVIIGTAFGKIVSSLVADLIMPIIGALIGGIRRARELGGVACRPQGYLRHRHDRRRGRGLPAAYGAAVGTDEGGA